MNATLCSPLEREIESFFNTVINPKNFWNKGLPYNIVESDDSYELAVELPGVDKKDINIEYKNDTITVKAKKKSPYNDEVEEIDKTFVLADKINKKNIEAKCENGILTVTFPKKAESKPKVISVK